MQQSVNQVRTMLYPPPWTMPTPADTVLARYRAAGVMEAISRGEQPTAAEVYEAAGVLRAWSWERPDRQIIDAAEALERATREGVRLPLDEPAAQWAARAAAAIRAAASNQAE